MWVSPPCPPKTAAAAVADYNSGIKRARLASALQVAAEAGPAEWEKAAEEEGERGEGGGEEEEEEEEEEEFSA